MPDSASVSESTYMPRAPARNPDGPDWGHDRVLRGGAWHLNLEADFRCANRDKSTPAFKNNSIGFRCASPADSD